MVSTNYNFRIQTTYTDQINGLTTQQEITVEQQQTTQAPEEILAAVFDKMLHEEVNSDPQWAEIAEKLAAEGGPKVSMELDNFGVDFKELAANQAPDIFFPASMTKAQQELADAVFELVSRTMGGAAPRKSLLEEQDSAPWREGVIQYALNNNALHINCQAPEKATQPLSQDIQRQVTGSQAPLMGTFNIKSMLTTSARPTTQRAPLTTNAKAPPAVNFANYKSADLHSQFVAKQASQTTAAKVPDVEIEHQKGDIEVNLARAVSSKFAAFLAECAVNGVPTNVQALLQWVLRESYLEGMEYLVYVRDKVRMANKGKQLLRDAASAARTELSRIATEATQKAKAETTDAFNTKRTEAKNGYIDEAKTFTKKVKQDGKKVDVSWSEEEQTEWVNKKMAEWDKNNTPPSATEISDAIDKYKDELTAASPYTKQSLDLNQDPPAMVNSSNSCKTYEELENYIDELEGKLSSLEDDAQLMNTDLQSVMEKQQELISTLSNVGKLLHDTALAIIRKMS